MTRLGDLCEFRYGKSLPAQRRREGPIPVYGSNGVVGSHDEAITNGKTIIIGRKGSIGEVNISADSCWPIDTTYYIDSDATEVDIHWLSGALSSLGLRELNKAAAVPGLNRGDAYEKKLFVPRIGEQRRIAAILDKADALRRKRKRALDLLDGLTRSIFLEMFGDPITNPFRLPVAKIGEICEVVTGNTPTRANRAFYGDAIEWIKSDNILPPERVLGRATEFLSHEGKSAARLAPSGSTLVTCIAGSPNSIGNCAMADREVAFNQQINALIPKELDPIFLYAQMRVGKRLVQEASTGGMKGLVSKSRLQGVTLLAPANPSQSAFAERAKHGLDLADRMRAAINKDTLFASLQSRAFSGQL